MTGHDLNYAIAVPSFTVITVFRPLKFRTRPLTFLLELERQADF
jgi:hypothetical protein